MYAEYIVKMILNNINSKFMNEQFIKTESKKKPLQKDQKS